MANGELRFFSNEFILNYYKERSLYHLYLLSFGVIKDPNITKTLVENVNSEYIECLNHYSPNDKQNTFLPTQKKCEKLKASGMIFSFAKDRFEIQVANYYPKNSVQASKILNPIHYMSQCIKQIDIHNGMTLTEYQRFATACTDIAQIDIAHNINLNLIDSYKPVIRGSNIRRPGQIDFACQNDIINKIHREVEGSSLTDQALRNLTCSMGSMSGQ